MSNYRHSKILEDLLYPYFQPMCFKWGWHIPYPMVGQSLHPMTLVKVISLKQGSANFLRKRQKWWLVSTDVTDNKYFRLEDYLVFVAATQLCSFSTKAAVDNTRKWMMLCYYKILFAKTGSEPDVATGRSLPAPGLKDEIWPKTSPSGLTGAYF